MFIENLKEQLNKYHLLKHPFYQKWSAGELSIDTLQRYSEQYYHHVNKFPQDIAAIYANCEDDDNRQILLGNLIDEAKGPENHPELWLRYAEELGTTREKVKKTIWNEQTKNLVEGFFAICNRGYSCGIGALYAYERQVPEIAKSKIDGLKKYYNINSEKGLKFFVEHIDADEWHTEECEQLINKLSSNEKQNAKIGALEAVKLLWNFLDGIEKN